MLRAYRIASITNRYPNNEIYFIALILRIILKIQKKTLLRHVSRKLGLPIRKDYNNIIRIQKITSNVDRLFIYCNITSSLLLRGIKATAHSCKE